MITEHDTTKALKQRSLDALKTMKDQIAYRKIARDHFNSILRNFPDFFVKATVLEEAGEKLIIEAERLFEANKACVKAYVEEAKHIGAIWERDRAKAMKDQADG